MGIVMDTTAVICGLIESGASFPSMHVAFEGGGAVPAVRTRCEQNGGGVNKGHKQGVNKGRRSE